MILAEAESKFIHLPNTADIVVFLNGQRFAIQKVEYLNGDICLCCHDNTAEDWK